MRARAVAMAWLDSGIDRIYIAASDPVSEVSKCDKEPSDAVTELTSLVCTTNFSHKRISWKSPDYMCDRVLDSARSRDGNYFRR